MYSKLDLELLEIKKKKSFQAFDFLCDGIQLAPFQSVSVLLWLAQKKGAFLFDPGLGKTITIAAGLRALFNMEPRTKVLMLIKKSQITQTTRDIKLYTKKRIVSCTAEQEQIEIKLFRNPDDYDILMLTHESLHSDTVCGFLSTIVNRFTVLVVDEAHFLTNIEECDRIIYLEALTHKIERVAFLTATPFITRSSQLVSLFYLLDSDTFNKRDDLTKNLNKGERFDTQFPLQIYNYDRKSENISNTYVPYIHWVEPHEFQRKARGAHYLQQVRGPGAENQVRELVQLLRKKSLEGKRGLVFIYYEETRNWVLPHLETAGINYGCIHGEMAQPARDQVQLDFQNKKLDVVIISITTAINLDCEYFCFYEYTHEFKQALGRAERGLNPKILELHFIFTKDTLDASHFYDTVYKLSAKVRSWIGKEYTEFLQVGELVKPEETGLGI